MDQLLSYYAASDLFFDTQPLPNECMCLSPVRVLAVDNQFIIHSLIKITLVLKCKLLIFLLQDIPSSHLTHVKADFHSVSGKVYIHSQI